MHLQVGFPREAKFLQGQGLHGLHLCPLGPRPHRPVHDGRVSSEDLQTLSGVHVPLPDGVVSAACEGSFVLQLAEGHIALVPCRRGG